jgi:hypothetical protein
MPETRIDIIFKEAYGYQLRAEIVEWDRTTEAWVAADISSFTTHDFEVIKPDGTSFTQTGNFETDGTDGILISTAIAMGVLDQGGDHKAQVILSNASQYFPTSIFTFFVDNPL